MRKVVTSRSPLLLLPCLSVTVSFLLAAPPSSTKPPKREVRAVWIATTSGLDWPRSANPDEQRRSLRAIIERISKARLNTLFFQVRGRGDALYRSPFEPWAAPLTGTPGRDPGWDPLEFAIGEAHKRGLELHAWFNTFKVKSGPGPLPQTVPPHVLEAHPEWVKQYKEEWWMDPAIPGVRDYLLRLVMDLVRKYDLDGIQFDFIRYPGIDYDDDDSYRRYGKTAGRAEWRRENITEFIRTAYDSISSVKPMMKVGSTPIGIYQNIGGSNGWEGRNSVFQDSRAWLKERKHDYLAPQIYWDIGVSEMDPDFSSLVADWQANCYGRQIYVGVGAYKPHVLKEIFREIDVVRSNRCAGVSFFRYENVADVRVFGGRFRTLANIPPMAWKDSIPPEPPANLTVTEMAHGNFLLTWNPPDVASDGDTARYYDVYRSTKEPVDIEDPDNLTFITASSTNAYLDIIGQPKAVKYYYTITALDKGHNESLPAIVEPVIVEEIDELARLFQPKTALGRSYVDPEQQVVYIPFSVQDSSLTSLWISNLDNIPAHILLDTLLSPGLYLTSLDLRNVQPGEYSCHLRTDTSLLEKPLKVEPRPAAKPL